MAQQSNDLRERLLAALPQPENLAAYREETAAMLGKHARALSWDKFLGYTLVIGAIALAWIDDHWHLGAHRLGWFPGLMFFVGMTHVVNCKIYDSQVATLKEIKQVQVQILELQKSLRKDQ
jgi:hypothetical protein